MILINIWAILKSLKKNYLGKKSFIVCWKVKKVSDKEYDHVVKFWNKFYQDLYLKFDALLLADVFEKFTNNSLKNYGLCPCCYLCTPVLTWDTMLNMTKMKLELIPDIL